MKNIKMILVMMVWGSIAVFSRWLNMSPVVLACVRALIALPVIWVIIKLRKGSGLNQLWAKENVPIYISGMFIGIAWVLLFYAYGNTSIANATLTYNMCPIYVLLLSKWFLKVDLKKWDVAMVLTAFIGIGVIVVHSISLDASDMMPILASSTAGVLYSIIIILNRQFPKTIHDDVKTFIQLLMASLVLLPLALLDNPVKQLIDLNMTQTVMLLILGIVHTGLAFYFYFASYKALSAIKIALLGYLEPVFAILFSVTLLGEKLGIYEVLGCILILGATSSKDIYQWFNRSKLNNAQIVEEV